MFQRALPSDIFQLVCSHTLNALLCTDPTAHNPFTALNNKDFQSLPCKIRDCGPITELTFILLILPKSKKGHLICTQFRILLQLIKGFKLQNFIALPSWRRCKGRKTHRIHKQPEHQQDLPWMKHISSSSLSKHITPGEPFPALPFMHYQHMLTLSLTIIIIIFYILWLPLAHPESSIFQRMSLPDLLLFI